LPAARSRSRTSSSQLLEGFDRQPQPDVVVLVGVEVAVDGVGEVEQCRRGLAGVQVVVHRRRERRPCLADGLAQTVVADFRSSVGGVDGVDGPLVRALQAVDPRLGLLDRGAVELDRRPIGA